MNSTQLHKAIATYRTNIATAKAEANRTALTPRSRNEIREEFSAALASDMNAARERAAQAVQSFAAGHDAARTVLVAETDTRPHLRDVALVGPVLASVLGIDAVMAALEPHFEALPEGIDSAAKARRLDELDELLFDLELKEEFALRELEAAGEVVTRRGDADPRAVLHPDPTPVTALAEGEEE